jgi:hypothetical protein
MKIEKVIVSTNSNPLYFDFWKSFSYVWKEKMGADPVLVYIDNDPDAAQIDDRWGEVIRVKTVDGVPEYLQTQWSRFFFARMFPESVCMTSDIDMYPLNRGYFMDEFAADGNWHVHLNGNGVTGRYEDWIAGNCNLTVCYHVNYGKQFPVIFDMMDSWEDEIRRLHSMNLGKDQSRWAEHLKGMNNWGAEEDYTTAVLRKKGTEGSVKMYTKGLFGRRFDRSDWDRCKQIAGTATDRFVDCHSLRPFSQNRDSVLEVLTLHHGKIDGSI